MPRIGKFVACASVLALSLTMIASAQGPGGRGGQGGRGGPGGFGGPGGPGGFGGSLFNLAQNPAVAEELKLTEKQKTALKKASDATNEQRQSLMALMRGGRGGNNQGKGQAEPQLDEDGNPIPPPSREEIQAAMQDLQANSDAALAKILNKSQRERLGQIDLQRAGPMAVLRPDVAQKLNIGEDQHALMQEVADGMRTEQRAMWQSNRDMMAPIRGADGNIDRAAMKARMDTPEVKSQMEEMRKQGDALQDQAIKAIGKLMTKKQKDTFNRMLGKEFDLAKLGGPGGFGGRRGPNPPPDAKAKDAAAGTTDAAKADDPTAKKGTRKATTKRKAAAAG